MAKRANKRRVGEVCLCFHMQRAARALARRFDEVFRPLDLTNWQFSLMCVLNRDTPPSMNRVASALTIDRTTLTAALKPLERRGLVTIAPDPDDKRSRLIAITAAGRALLAEAMPIWRRTHAAIERGLASPDRLRGELRLLS